MARKLKPEKTAPSSHLISIHTVEHMLSQSSDGLIAFDLEGHIFAMNQAARGLFGKSDQKLLEDHPNQPIWDLIKLNTIALKRQFIRARRAFVLAKQGMAQECTWLETLDSKPIHAYHIMFYSMDIEGKALIFAKFDDLTQTKLIEWVLWSLARISNHHEIAEVIDDILKLVSEVFTAKHALVSLIDAQGNARSVSHFRMGIKSDNVNYILADSPSANILLEKDYYHLVVSGADYPQDPLLKGLKVCTYLSGPIKNVEGQVVGIMNVISGHAIEKNTLNCTLFRVFLERINLEIERLLNQRKLQFLASIPQQDPNPMIRILPHGDVVYANTQGKSILKYWLKIHKKIPEKLLDAVSRAQSSDQIVRIEMDAENKVYLFTLVWVPEFKQINIYGTDISQLKTTEKDMRNLARFDALTQIANRQYFEEKLIDKLHEHHVDRSCLALLLIDLDNFKTINDTLGHPIGDRLLKAATKRMERCLRQDDFIARLGGDEFIVLLNQTSIESAILVAEKIINVLSRSFQFGEYHMNITASVGIALYPDTGLTPSDLLRHADIAMYQAKKTGKNNFAVFSKTLHFIHDKRNEIIRKELKFAVSKNELYLEYQPQFDINTNQIIGFEALLRWHHPDQGLILPNEFIPMAEQTGCIQIISQWTIEQSLNDYTQYLQSYTAAELSINVSLNQLNDARFLDALSDNLNNYNIPKNKIILDIAERAIASNFKQVARNLKKIHSTGIALSLDDFGNPQIALPKLLALPISYLKLDPQLIHGIEKSEKLRILYAGIIKLAKELGLETIQKGIETQEQHEEVKALGCPISQGFYYCKPLRIHELVVLINQLNSLPN